MVTTRESSRNGWIEKNYKTEMKFWAVLGRQGYGEKNLPTAISMQLFVGKIDFFNVISASLLKSYIA